MEGTVHVMIIIETIRITTSCVDQRSHDDVVEGVPSVAEVVRSRDRGKCIHADHFVIVRAGLAAPK